MENWALRIGAQPIEDQNNCRPSMLKKAARESGSGPRLFRRLAQPLHCEFDIERLQGAPTLDFRLISILRVAKAGGSEQGKSPGAFP
jgi:hypothetical protein